MRDSIAPNTLGYVYRESNVAWMVCQTTSTGNRIMSPRFKTKGVGDLLSTNSGLIDRSPDVQTLPGKIQCHKRSARQVTRWYVTLSDPPWKALQVYCSSPSITSSSDRTVSLSNLYRYRNCSLLHSAKCRICRGRATCSWKSCKCAIFCCWDRLLAIVHTTVTTKRLSPVKVLVKPTPKQA